MDRLFLTGLVAEIGDAWVGATVRGVSVDREASLLALDTNRRKTGGLVVSFAPDAPGLYRGVAVGAATPAANLKKWMVGARIDAVAISPLDRIVTISLEHTRLSGRKSSVELVLEIMGARVVLFVVGAASEAVIEVYGSGRKRLTAGERYMRPEPPPHASRLALDRSTFEKRRVESPQATLLATSGGTPLLVSEMNWLVERTAATESEAFATVRDRLRNPTPTLYRSGFRTIASPILLQSKGDVESRSFASFNEAMMEAVARSFARRVVEAKRARLERALGDGRTKLGRLQDKLERQQGSAEKPERLRRMGEQILAGMAGARRVTADVNVSVVRLTDAFDPEATEIEIPIDARLDLPANAERFFKRARRAERATRLVAARLAEVALKTEALDGFAVALRDAMGQEELGELELEAADLGLVRLSRRGNTERRGAARLGPREFGTSRGGTILVGRSARGNDELTFKVARPEDLWFHASGIAGGHVVLRVPAGREPADEEVELAASLAAFYSKARDDAYVEVIVTKRKNVAKLKGAPIGTVRVKEHRTIRVAPGQPDPRVRPDEPG